MRRLLATAGDADASLADVTYEAAPDANETWEVRLNLTENDDVAKFRSLNDGVMGGMSDGFMARRTGNDGGSFMGNISLERNGGFASVRAMVDENAGDFDGVYIEAKTSTPEKKFLFILKDEDCLREQINFKVNFKVGSEYARVKIPFAAFSRAERMGRVCFEPAGLNEPQRNWLDDPQGGAFASRTVRALRARNRLLPRLIQLRVIFIQIRSFSYLCSASDASEASISFSSVLPEMHIPDPSTK